MMLAMRIFQTVQMRARSDLKLAGGDAVPAVGAGFDEGRTLIADSNIVVIGCASMAGRELQVGDRISAATPIDEIIS